jgi:hypothetical protein
LENIKGRLQSRTPGSNSKAWGMFYDGLGSSVMVLYSVGPSITLNGRITARCAWTCWFNQLHPMIQMLFLKNDAVFQDDSSYIHTAGTVQSWFEEHEGELQHLPCPAQSSGLNIIEQF